MSEKVKISEPVCVEVTVSHSGDGKVAIEEYGKHSTGWSLFLSRKYLVPEGWTEEQINEFQVAKHDLLRELVDALDQNEFDERWAQKKWK